MIDYILGGLILGAMILAIIHLIKNRKQGGCAGCPSCGQCAGHCNTNHPSEK